MIDFPPITIVVTTYYPDGADGEARAAVVEQTLASWAEHMRYPEEIRLHFADDGSTPEAQGVVRFIRIPSRFGIRSFSVQQRHGVGASLNTGFQTAFRLSPLVLYAVDDWHLEYPCDLRPWAHLLMTRPDVGMVRLGPGHPGVTGTIKAYTEMWDGWGLCLDRHHYAFGHRPALYHKRMIDAYGWFKEDCNAYECERLYNENFCANTGPDIVLALPSPFFHLESCELAGIEPEGTKEGE